MTRLLSDKHRWSRAALLLLLPGCLVSFNDYPLGDIEGSGGTKASAGAGPTSAGGASGGQGVLPLAGKPNAAGSGGSDGGGSSSTVPVLENMIDDFQDDDPAILEQQGRAGTWYVGNDGTGTQSPEVGPSVLDPARGASTRGLHTAGGPFKDWGALVGTSLATSGDMGADYDLSGYRGLRLWVRSGSTAANTAKFVRLNLPTPATNNECTECNDHFGYEVPLTSQWVLVQIPFTSLKQRGYGRPAPARPDLAHVTSLQLGFPKDVAFDLWVDDIELY